jgi:DNA/RNA-binding domain of Phe-tRNA-synthetase-like protein
MVTIQIDDSVANLAVAVVQAEGVTIETSSAELRAYCDEATRSAAKNDQEQRRQAVRALLRLGGFKPSGRSKPAQEYLLRTVEETGALPAIWNAVDLINAVSVESGLPISLISLDRIAAPFLFRYGAPGEKFVFNSAGQEIDVNGLICLCSGHVKESRPVGTPVKDSLEAKVIESDRNVLACIYLPAAEVARGEAQRWADQLAHGFRCWCKASDCTAWIGTAKRTI